MKYLKTFENLKFKVGDYVKIIPNRRIIPEIEEFYENNIGIIYDKERDIDDILFYNIKFENVPEHLAINTRWMGSVPPKGLKKQGEIFIADENELRLATSKEIEEYLLKKDVKKYNL